MKEHIERVTFNVQDRLIIADPCYIDSDDATDDLATPESALDSNSSRPLGLVLENCQGTWEANVEMRDDRVATLHAQKVGCTPLFYDAPIYVGKAGVDSGQMLIGCATVFGLDYDELLERYKLPDGSWNDELKFFGFGEAAVSSTGWGDGSYPVLMKCDTDGVPIAVEVRFMDDDEEYDE